MIKPYTLMDAPMEVVVYIIFPGLFHAAILGVGLLLATPLAWRGWRRYWVFARGFTVFSVLFLLTAAVMNAAWSCSIWGRVYFSTDYVTDFNPLFPINQAWIEEPFGDQKGRLLHGYGMLHVRAAWAAFALATWVGTFMLYLRARRLWTTPGNAGPDDPPPGELCVHG